MRCEKNYIDLGIRIVFDGLDKLSNRSANAAKDILYHAIGIIDYRSADGAECTNGHVLYIKPAYHGTEGAGIVSYATAHDTFPTKTPLISGFPNRSQELSLTRGGN
ncbi:MAG: hypothetical protein WB774_12105 [Xanthobacteraceae bacterium]